MKKFLLCSIAGCGLMLLAVGTADAKGSLAVNKGNPKQFGWAVNMHSFGESDDSALSHCGRGCEVVYHFNGTCAGVCFAGPPQRRHRLVSRADTRRSGARRRPGVREVLVHRLRSSRLGLRHRLSLRIRINT